MQLQNKHALITGAASGFGREMAREFVKEGAKVSVVDLNGPGAKAVADELGNSAMAMECDVSKAVDIMINVGSTGGIRPRPGLSWYNSSKGAVNTLTRSLAVDLAADRIRVCGLAPVMSATGLLETFMGMEDTPDNREKFLSTIPLGRLCDTKDIANAAVFLSSDKADFITGVILEVDGGRTI